MKKITVANGDVTDTLGAVSDLKISFEDIHVALDFLVINNPSFDVIIGLPALESLQACINLGNQTVTIRHEKKEVKLALDNDLSKIFLPEVETDSNEFTAEATLIALPRIQTSSPTFRICFQMMRQIQKGFRFNTTPPKKVFYI